MQATVSKYDASTRAGAVLTDTGIELPFAATALEGTPLRFLRPGQRVRIETTGTGESTIVTSVRFITIG
jgi:cold shock CspA family protein